MKRFYAIVLAVIFFAAFTYSCNVVKEVSNTLTNISRLQFKLAHVNDFRLAGINVESKKSVNDFSMMDGVKLTKAFATKNMPATFILNVEAKNPNDGSGGTPKTSATMTGFDWKLYIDGKETIAGNIANPVSVPGTGQATYIPLSIEIDLYDFFANKGYDDILNLAMAIGGANGSTSRLTLDAKPTVRTSFGPMTYPGRIKIVDKEWN
jgi:hypothetical protein